MDEVIKRLDEAITNGEEIEKPSDEDVESILKKRKNPAKVFCVACGAINRTLRKWHNSYLCVDCFKIAKNVGDEKFIKALKGEEN